MKNKLPLILIILLFKLNISFTQEPPMMGYSADSIIQIKGKLIESLTGNFSATFQSTSINDVMRIFSLQTGLQFVISPKVNATVTMNLKDAPIKEAFYTILSINNLYYLEKSNIIKILTLQEYKTSLIQEYLVTKVYDASIIDIKNLPTLLRPLLTPGVGNFVVDLQSSKIIVSDVEDNLVRIDNLFNEITSPPKQVEIEVRIVEFDIKDGSEFGINWSALDILNLANSLGRNVVNVDLPFINKSGPGDDSIKITGTKVFGNIDAVISALSKKYKVKLISQPKILAINRGSATILIGSKVPYIKSILKDSSSQNPQQTSQVEFVDVGVKVEISPTVSINNEIKMKLKVQLSSYKSIDITSTEKAPEIVTTEVECETVNKNNQTMIIGGLIKTEKTKEVRGVPFLADIPVLNWFFAHTIESENKSETVIFLTPRIIEKGKSNLELQPYSLEIMYDALSNNYTNLTSSTVNITNK